MLLLLMVVVFTYIQVLRQVDNTSFIFILYLLETYTHLGVKINTPHYLVKLSNLPRGTHTYTVVVSQFESLTTIYYTIKVQSLGTM